MAKWAGIIGFATQSETTEDGQPSGIWVETVTERNYTGDLIRNKKINQNTSTINDGINISNQISFIADPYALTNFLTIRYATFMGQKWKVKDIDFEQPRMLITLGDVYNG